MNRIQFLICNPHYWTENYNYNGYHDTLTLIIDSFSSLDDSSPIQFKWQNKNRIEDIVYSMTHLNKCHEGPSFKVSLYAGSFY